jgi:hypothetical protein
MKTTSIKPIIIFFFFLVFCGNLSAQEINTSLKGRIVDEGTQSPVPFANVIIEGSDPLIGETTDIDGYFRLTNIEVGRVSIRISSIGYEDQVVPNVMLISGKETFLNIELKEAFASLDEIVVKARENTADAENPMAQLSARALSIEASHRYAGGIGDPARLVSSFAGVASTGEGNNDIIVRGNNPRYVQWRLEGTEIPNPNHFGQEGLSGGPISALNSQVLANSSFYTGAFPAQFGNVLSSVFDVRFRNGNADKREHSFSLGVLGVDFTTEGPLKKESNSSYLVNYRYSTLGLLDQLGVVDFGGVPLYQDAAFKLFIPTKKAGTFSIFGLMGNSEISQEVNDFEDEGEGETERITSSFLTKSNLGIWGVKHVLATGDKSYLKTTLSYAINGNKDEAFRVYDLPEQEKEYEADLSNTTFRVNSSFNYKVNSRHQFATGIIASYYKFDFQSSYFDQAADQFLLAQNTICDARLGQAFATWKWRITERLSYVGGIHLQKGSQNEQVSVEPRTSLRYEMDNRQALTAGFGVHSKQSSLSNYFTVVYDENGGPSQPNTNLKFMKARHFVMGYERHLSPVLRLKAEAYYQQLYDIPVESGSSSYSLLNQQQDLADRVLENTGKGKNYGIDLTLEKDFAANYYFMVTGSLYKAKYQGSDQVWRNGRYSGNYLANILVGKEFKMGKTKDNVLSLNTRLSYLGAKYLLDIKLDESIASGSEVYDEENAFQNRGSDIFSVNLAASYQINKARSSHSFKLDIQNATNNQGIIDYYYSDVTKEIEEITQLALLPVLSYTINF